MLKVTLTEKEREWLFATVTNHLIDLDDRIAEVEDEGRPAEIKRLQRLKAEADTLAGKLAGR